MIDVNVYLSRWPFRRLPHDETSQLLRKLTEEGVTQAWVGSFDALLHKDIAAVNARLADECKQHDMLRPIGTVNPALPDWQEDLRRCQERHGMAGIRLHPNYHGYKLDDPRFKELIQRAAKRKMFVQLVLKMEDERTQHPLVRVPTVNTRPLKQVAESIEGLRLVILNGMRDLQPHDLDQLTKLPSAFFEIAMLEGVGNVRQLIRQVGIEHILFGSYFPMFYWEAAKLKLQEAGLAPGEIRKITRDNPQTLLGSPR